MAIAPPGVNDLLQAIPPSNDLVLGFRFGVFFFAGGVVPNPLDIRFQKVSGISASVKTTPLEEGGQNLYSHPLPERIEYQPLSLERGIMIGSPLSMKFNVAMSQFQFAPSNVLVTLLGDLGLPLAAWMFFKVYPVKWSVSDPDANQKEVAIETMELAYSYMQKMSV